MAPRDDFGILGFVVKSAPDTQRAVDREDAAQRWVSPLRVTLQHSWICSHESQLLP
jgi:hypothetical protein